MSEAKQTHVKVDGTLVDVVSGQCPECSLPVDDREALIAAARRVLEKGYDCDCCYMSYADQATRLVVTRIDGVTTALMCEGCISELPYRCNHERNKEGVCLNGCEVDVLLVVLR